ncbi:MAG: hypothetical protein JSS98_04710 [Bacteroidetes bacterium]|nr:hypothetical protein [Bacteroidota bacterium]
MNGFFPFFFRIRFIGNTAAYKNCNSILPNLHAAQIYK